jgi:hypothetical protein
VKLAVDEVALECISLEFFSFWLLIIIPPLFRNHLSPPSKVYESPDQTALYHILGV